MASRTKKSIPIGSGYFHLIEYTGTLSALADLIAQLKESTRFGTTTGGATLTYAGTTHEEKDDLGHVSKIITTSEEALLKCGLLTWNGKTLTKLVDRGTSTEASGKRTTKIGGAGNGSNKQYVICFLHEDSTDGNLWVLIKGKNTAGFTLTFSTVEGTVVEPEFKALPHDDNGTLIELIEEIPNT